MIVCRKCLDANGCTCDPFYDKGAIRENLFDVVGPFYNEKYKKTLLRLGKWIENDLYKRGLSRKKHKLSIITSLFFDTYETT